VRLKPSQAQRFQDNILRTILQLEKTFFDMAEEDQGNVLIVCDRGAMDPSACESVWVCEKEINVTINVPGQVQSLH